MRTSAKVSNKKKKNTPNDCLRLEMPREIEVYVRALETGLKSITICSFLENQLCKIMRKNY